MIHQLNYLWTLELLLLLSTTFYSSYGINQLSFVNRNNKVMTPLADWPCPLAEEIAPCLCGTHMDSPAKLEVICEDVVDVEEIQRVFSMEFPFNNLEFITILVNDYELWMNHSAVVIPQNTFGDKTAKDIWISIKVAEVHPQAFDNMAETLTSLSISGAGHVDGQNTLEFFPLYILQDFPNLQWFMLQETMLSDRTFESKPTFNELTLPNLEVLHFAGGMLTNVPKLCTAPKLREIRFAYNPIATIEPKAFDDLPSLENLDMAGNGESTPGLEQTLTVLETDSLAMSAALNFSLLSMGEWEHLDTFEPGFISNIKHYTIMDFMGKWGNMAKIKTIPEESFREIFEIISPPGHINFGRNPLLCDCSIKWILEDIQMLEVIDWPGAPSYARPTCRDGTLLADLDLDVMNALCPED